MKVTIVLLAALVLTVLAFTAEPLAPAVTQFAGTPEEPALMVASGAILLVLASMLKRLPN